MAVGSRRQMELEWVQQQPELSETAPPAVVTGGWRERLGWILGLLAAVVVTGVTVWNLTRPPDALLIRTTIPLPPGLELDDRQDSRPLALSPDGSRLVYCALGGGAESRLFLRPLDQFEATPLPGTENAINPFFSPDGEAELVLAVREGRQFPMSWSPDGRSLVFYEMYPSTGRDIWMLPPEGEPVPLVVTEANERSPRFSRNGRWLAYVSDESGRDEIYVQAFPGPGGKQVISTNGGREPVWSRDGTELFYRRGDELLAVDVDTGDELEAGTPRTLLTARFARSLGGRNQNYDVSLDGKRFVYVQRDEGVRRELRVVVNWFEELERLAPP